MDNHYKDLVQVFQNPHADYGPVVMWFWNDFITEDGITFQMEKFREQGITNFYIHPACGFAIEYLSDRFNYYYFELAWLLGSFSLGMLQFISFPLKNTAFYVGFG